MAWKIGHGPLNQTHNFYGRKKEEREIRGVEQAKSRFFQTTQVMFDSKTLHPPDDDLTEVKTQTNTWCISSVKSKLCSDDFYCHKN